MKHSFQLPDLPGSEFVIETSFLSGKSRLYMDNIPVEQSREKGKPYLIPTPAGSFIKAYPKRVPLEFVPTLEINGTVHRIVTKLSWHEYLIGGLPFLLVFIGGLIGGALGAAGTVTNYAIFRGESTATIKYIKIIGITVGVYFAYFLLAVGLNLLIRS
ncbi:MAG: hypothetical protein Q8909_15785 [Bacteroidota bacterium]|nr:hypothetical protein [Bacteroidota bacterium]